MKLIYNIKLAMLACHLWFLSNAIAASIRFVQPAGGAVISAGRALDVQWIYPDSLDAQLASDRLNLFLCAGGNEFGSYEALVPLIEHGNLHDITSLSVIIPPSLGGVSPNAYFLELSVDVSNGTTSFFSDRFTFTGMTGAFSPHIVSALMTISGTTAGPITYHDIYKREVDAPLAGRQANLPFGKQTGLTRYAPVPGLPPTKISLKTAAPLFPTSAYKLATTYLPTPTIMTTISAPATVVKQVENTAAPAPHPEDDMHRFLNRWKD